MATTVLQQLDGRLPASGVVICKDDHATLEEMEFLYSHGVQVHMASHPVPDHRSVQEAALLMDMIRTRRSPRTLPLRMPGRMHNILPPRLAWAHRWRIQPHWPKDVRHYLCKCNCLQTLHHRQCRQQSRHLGTHIQLEKSGLEPSYQQPCHSKLRLR